MALVSLKVIGKLSFSVEESNVVGRSRSRSSVVYRGLYEDTIPVAVKRILKNDTRIIEAEQLRQYDRHQNIVRYYVTESDDFFHHIGMELCNGTLEQLIRGQYTGPPIGKDKEILRQIASAIEYLNKQRLVIRNVTPNNILISRPDGPDPPKMKLVDFSMIRKIEFATEELECEVISTNEWTAPELLQQGSRYTGAVDVFSAGCVFAYFLSRGRHPFGEVVNRQCNICSGNVKMPREIVDCAASDLIAKMLKHNPTERISIQQVLAHPYFWNEEKSLTFIQVASQILETDGILSQVLESGRARIFIGGWPYHLTPNVMNDLMTGMLRIKNKPEVTMSVLHLLKAIRNKWEHLGNACEAAKADYGSSPESYFRYWSSRFPRLFMHTWTVMKTKESNLSLREFY